MLRYFFIFIFILSSSFLSAQDHLRAPNSYVYDVDYADFNHFGGLAIPVKKAYAVWNEESGFLNNPIPNGIQSAAVFWEDVPGLIRSVSISGSGENAVIKVAVNPGKGKGNANISFHVGNAGNESDPIFWTWHVWITDDPTQGYEYTKGFETNNQDQRFNPKHMDRNLGAVNPYFLGDNWHKSVGLFYQWGRKDPFPPLLHKDRSFYELNGVVGEITHMYAQNPKSNHYEMKPRPSSDEGENIQYSIQHPIEYIVDPEGTGTWFSEKSYKSIEPLTAWDLWSDNTRGGNSNANSSNTELSKDSKSYEIKSVYDPCPGGWRVVSNYGREASNNNLSPYGGMGGGNDDVTNSWAEGQGFYLDSNVNGGKPNSTIMPDVENPALAGLKVYPKLGFDFREVSGRKLGVIPITGLFEMYKTNGVFSHSLYHDELSAGGLWSATFGSSHPRFAYFIADADQTDNQIGRYLVRINDITFSSRGHNIRCIKDPNEDLIGVFGTNYIQTSEYQNYKEGLDNPNSYVLDGSIQTLKIPVNKAFSVYNQYFSENGEMLLGNDLKTNVLWTTNKNLIKSISIVQAEDAKNSKIKITFNPSEYGNAVVSLHNGNINNPVYWSWHIWAPKSEITTLTYTTESVIPAEYHIVNATESKYPPLTTEFMDRNIGAIEAFPTLSNPNSPSQQEKVQISESGGFHFQWGRKDPIPSFQKVGNESYEIYKGIEVNEQGEVLYQSLTSQDYDSFYTEEYSNYSSHAGVQNSDSKHTNAKRVLKYAAENPLTFLYHGGQGEIYTAPNAIDEKKMRDWISNSIGVDGDRALLSNRWGHATKKSSFDPCPDGWRVPDFSIVLLKTSGKGTSPWYFGNNGSKGIDQRDYYRINDYYGGTNIQMNSKFVGWNLNHSAFSIGNFPRTGTRGELGGAELSETTGIWSAALSDYMIGYGLGMQFSKENHLRTGTGVYPQAGMNVRCAKDEPRYIADQDGFLSNNEIYISDDEYLLVYPNPVKDFLHIQSDEKFTYSIFNLAGSLVDEGKVKNQRISFGFLPKGIYILILNDQLVKKIIKN